MTYAITFRCVDGCHHPLGTDYPYTATFFVTDKDAKQIEVSGVYKNPDWKPKGWLGCESCGGNWCQHHSIRVVAKEHEPYTHREGEEKDNDF